MVWLCAEGQRDNALLIEPFLPPRELVPPLSSLLLVSSALFAVCCSRACLVLACGSEEEGAVLMRERLWRVCDVWLSFDVCCCKELRFGGERGGR